MREAITKIIDEIEKHQGEIMDDKSDNTCMRVNKIIRLEAIKTSAVNIAKRYHDICNP